MANAEAWVGSPLTGMVATVPDTADISLKRHSSKKASTPRHCLECGAIIPQDIKSKHRSSPQHRRYFAIIRAAWHNWPEDGGTSRFRPQNEEHFRYWLEMRAGHYTVTKTARIESTDPDKAYMLVSSFLRPSKDTTLFLELDGNLLTQKQTRSISYASLGPAEFGRLKDAVCEIIEAELNVTAEQLLQARAA